MNPKLRTTLAAVSGTGLQEITPKPAVLLPENIWEKIPEFVIHGQCFAADLVGNPPRGKIGLVDNNPGKTNRNHRDFLTAIAEWIEQETGENSEVIRLILTIAFLFGVHNFFWSSVSSRNSHLRKVFLFYFAINQQLLARLFLNISSQDNQKVVAELLKSTLNTTRFKEQISGSVTSAALIEALKGPLKKTVFNFVRLLTDRRS